MAPKPERRDASAATTGVTVIGAPPVSLRDVYHLFLRTSWPIALGCIVIAWLAINAVFADLYLTVGGVTSMRTHSFWDAFCFSVQTMGTIGYGSMYPTTVAANVVMIAESVTSLIVTAVATGMVFTKFSRSTSRVVFSKRLAIGPMNGVPTLMLRVGNARGNAILEATVRIAYTRTERMKEGTTFYRMVDVRPTRDRSPAMARTWTVLHPITPDSPLYGASPESIAREDGEFLVTVVGIDDTSLQQVHARARYLDRHVVWGARHGDILSEDSDGNLVLDVRRFDELEPTEPTESFPYPRDARA
jgi:inward rectifier potassium channel